MLKGIKFPLCEYKSKLALFHSCVHHSWRFSASSISKIATNTQIVVSFQQKSCAILTVALKKRGQKDVLMMIELPS